MEERALGIDFSKYAQDWILPDPKRLDFAIQRTSYGLTKDQKFFEHGKRMGQVDIRGAYHFYEEKHPTIKQVDLFSFLVEKHPWGIHLVAWDVEVNELCGNFFKDRQRIAEHTRKAVDILENRFPNVCIYLNGDVFRNYLNPYLKEWLKKRRIWFAWPSDMPISECRKIGIDPWQPNGMAGWWLWQCSWKGAPDYFGIIGKLAVDVDVFNGTAWQMKCALGIKKQLPYQIRRIKAGIKERAIKRELV